MKRFIILFCVAIFMLSSCTKRLDKLATDPNNPSLDDPSVAQGAASALFSAAISNGLMRSFEFQRLQALHSDLYGGHFATSAKYFPSDRYGINQSWLNAGLQLFYPRDIGNVVAIIKSDYATDNQKNIARIWKVFLFHRYVDFFGDLPYFNVTDITKPEVYDNQKDIYYDFFKELKEASNALDVNTKLSFDAKDVIYGASANETLAWKKFGNTLRLRLAMRISKADPAKAKTEAEEAVAAGVFTDNTDNALAKVNAILPNALNQISGFNEFRMSANSESILVGYKDPRLKEFFSPADGGTGADAPYIGVYNGLRNGLNPADMDVPENKNINNSNLGPRFSKANEASNVRIVLTYAEACFLLAEAKLNNWNVGAVTAVDWYNKGIEASLKQFGISDAAVITAYQNNTTDIATTPVGTGRPVTTVSKKFSATVAEQREQVGTQKWIAVYPDGFEAWANFRRTGFPKLYLPANYEAGTDVPVGEFIQRMPYTDYLRALNPQEVLKAEARMGGGGQSIKLWFAGGK
ncbi:MAG: SusD/RagB family nutrient-binding outer membrane lipoprotein [Chitinophagaceae bacterium]|nr:SusD/RagB family nutrient-binding outer membrane lipoprotein [Chitinophagaceae bacterium]